MGGMPSESALTNVRVGGSSAVIEPSLSSLSVAVVISSCMRDTTEEGFAITDLVSQAWFL